MAGVRTVLVSEFFDKLTKNPNQEKKMAGRREMGGVNCSTNWQRIKMGLFWTNWQRIKI